MIYQSQKHIFSIVSLKGLGWGVSWKRAQCLPFLWSRKYCVQRYAVSKQGTNFTFQHLAYLKGLRVDANSQDYTAGLFNIALILIQ